MGSASAHDFSLVMQNDSVVATASEGSQSVGLGASAPSTVIGDSGVRMRSTVFFESNCFPAPHGPTRSSHIRGQEGEQVLLAVG